MNNCARTWLPNKPASVASYGLGAGVGRGLGVGVNRGVADAVALGVGVGDTVGVGVGPDCTQYLAPVFK